MHKLISLKHISVSSVSPKQQKRVQISKHSEPSCPSSPKLCFSVFHRYRSSNCADLQPSSTSDSEQANTEVMPIPVSEELRLWLHERNLQGFIKVAEAEPHPQAEELVQQLDITKVTTKKIRNALQMPRGGFDAVKKPSSEALQSYFGEYSPSAKAYQTYGGRDEFFHEVARFLLEVGFVSPRFYCMPKKRAGFIIAAYEKEDFNWPLLSGEALREQLQGVKTGKPMKQIFGRWLSVLFPIQESETPVQSRRPPIVQAPRRHRQVPHEEWTEEESAHADNIQTEMPQSEPPRPENSENRQPTAEQEADDPLLNQQQSTENRQQAEKMPQRTRVKQKANRQFHPENSDESAPKRQRTTVNSNTPVVTEVIKPGNEGVSTQLQQGQSSKVAIREAHGCLDIPPAAHELAAILQFGTSYELVEWLARRLTEVSERLAQEHHDRIMIQKSLRGVLEPQEKAEVEKIGRKRNAQNRGEAIEMPPLHEALVEIHKEYEKARKTASDMADRYKSMTASAEVLKQQFCIIQTENKELKDSLKEWETQVRITTTEKEWQKKLEEAEEARQAETTRANDAVVRIMDLEKQKESMQYSHHKIIEEKEQLIKELQKSLEEAKTANNTYTEQIEEFEKYIVTQESQLAEKQRSLEEVNRKMMEKQEEWNKEKLALEQQLDETRKVSEQRRLDIYVAEAKLMQSESEARGTITDLRKELQAAQFDASITKDKVQHIIWKHRAQAKKMIDDSLAEGWKLWTAQAAELQLLRADKINRQVQGPGFFKMAQKDIDSIQEDIMKDMDEIAAFYKEEIQRIMQEFDKHDIGTSVQLDKIEAERTSKTPNLPASERSEPEQPIGAQQSKPAPNEECDTDDDEDDGRQPRSEEPSIFDILNDSDEEPQD